MRRSRWRHVNSFARLGDGEQRAMTDIKKAEALAAKITKKAEDALASLEWEMAKWPAEYRAIMWGAVADTAFKRKVEAEQAR